jgi:hypothetical protein
MAPNCYQTVKNAQEITTDGRKDLVIGTGPKTPPPPVAVEALHEHVQQSIKHYRSCF